MAHGPRKKPLDFGGNPDHATFGLGQGRVRVTVSWVSGSDVVVYPIMCLNINIILQRRPWRRYALY